MAKERCKTCNQKIIPKDPRTLEEAIERMDVSQPIVQLESWMLKFFEWRSLMLDSEGRPTTNPKLCVSRKTQWRPKPGAGKTRKRKTNKDA